MLVSFHGENVRLHTHNLPDVEQEREEMNKLTNKSNITHIGTPSPDMIFAFTATDCFSLGEADAVKLKPHIDALAERVRKKRLDKISEGLDKVPVVRFWMCEKSNKAGCADCRARLPHYKGPDCDHYCGREGKIKCIPQPDGCSCRPWPDFNSIKSCIIHGI